MAFLWLAPLCAHATVSPPLWLLRRLCTGPHPDWELDQWNTAGPYLLCSADDPNGDEGQNFKRPANETRLFRRNHSGHFALIANVRILFDGRYLATTYHVPPETARSLVSGMHAATFISAARLPQSARGAFVGIWRTDPNAPLHPYDVHALSDTACTFTPATVSCAPTGPSFHYILTSSSEAFVSLSSVNYWMFDLQPDGTLFFRIREHHLWAALHRAPALTSGGG
ncbi:MAG TPA: hypothetical protein VME66_01690 [Candidatus Acidoferrales bacterium]|nr:hypothetical protein [Candidatus Acidoferrales bacterium]